MMSMKLQSREFFKIICSIYLFKSRCKINYDFAKNIIKNFTEAKNENLVIGLKKSFTVERKNSPRLSIQKTKFV